jgi:hypothetical protein
VKVTIRRNTADDADVVITKSDDGITIEYGWHADIEVLAQAINARRKDLGITATVLPTEMPKCPDCGCELSMRVGGLEHHAPGCEYFPI